MSFKSNVTKVSALLFLFSCASHETKYQVGDTSYDFSKMSWAESQRDPAQAMGLVRAVETMAEESPAAFKGIVSYIGKMSGVSAKTMAAIKTPKDLSSLPGSVKSRFLGRIAENPRLIANLDFSKNVSELSKVSPDIELLAASAKVNAKQAGEVRSIAFSARSSKILGAAVAKNPENKAAITKTAKAYQTALKSAAGDKERIELAELALTQRLVQTSAWDGQSVVGDLAVQCFDNQALATINSVSGRVWSRFGKNKPQNLPAETARGLAEELNPSIKSQEEFQTALRDGAERVEALRRKPCNGSLGF